MYNQFFRIKPRISEKNGGSKVVQLIFSHVIVVTAGNSKFGEHIINMKDFSPIKQVFLRK